MSDDIRIHDPASKQKEKQPYGRRDLENIMAAHQARNWDDLINWVRKEGDKVRGVTPGEAKQMVEDFSRLKQRGARFTKDPNELYQQARASA